MTEDPEVGKKAGAGGIVLEPAEWTALAGAHFERVRPWTQACRERRARGEKHPVHDFLFTYYSYPMGRLERWHPGDGITCRCPDPSVWRKYFSRRDYHWQGGEVRLRGERLTGRRRKGLEWILDLLRRTQSRPGRFACHGLHEWAMVYRGREIRHREVVNLRLPQQEVDALVRSRPLCCTHFDAFRFFVPETRPMNLHQPDLDSRASFEQPGCLHANMDLYKWSYKALPWISSELNWKCFELAMQGRELDMRASPYDLADFGYQPIKIETPQGREEYERCQRELSEKARPLRLELIDALAALLLNVSHRSEGKG